MRIEKQQATKVFAKAGLDNVTLNGASIHSKNNSKAGARMKLRSECWLLVPELQSYCLQSKGPYLIR